MTELEDKIAKKLLETLDSSHQNFRQDAIRNYSEFVNACAVRRMSVLKADASLSVTGCDRAVPGWICTRKRGHDGPCAAIESCSAAPQN